MIDSNKRSLAKAISWRIFAIILLACVTYLLTNNIKTVTLVTMLYHSIQVVAFYIHEKIWNFVGWGRTKGMFIQLTGMSGAGKTTISEAVAQKLRAQNYQVEIIDGDEYRKNISKDLGFSKDDRIQNIQRLGFIGQVLSRNKVIAIMATINPYESARQELARLGAKTIYIKCSLDKLKARDTKGLYYRALLNDGHPDKLYNFTGISDPFEEPTNPDLTINTEHETLEESVNKVYKFIIKNSQ